MTASAAGRQDRDFQIGRLAGRLLSSPAAYYISIWQGISMVPKGRDWMKQEIVALL
jgi:hypothetical protein